jgi:hypothetical protein
MTTNFENSFESEGRNEQPVALPNATVILVLGILSIIGCCCYGILGTILGIIALVLANSSSKLYAEAPIRYTESSYKNLTAGKICAIIGLALSLLVVILYIVIIAIFGWAVFTDPTIMYEYFGVSSPY